MLSAVRSAVAFACFVPGLGPPRASPFFLGGIMQYIQRIDLYNCEYIQNDARGVDYTSAGQGKK